MLLLSCLVLISLATLLVAMEPIHTVTDDDSERLRGQVDGMDADTREALI